MGRGWRSARRTKGPAALISGGECTVTIQDTKENESGRGGRARSFFFPGIETGILAIAADTDGIDGSEERRRDSHAQA